MTNAGIRDSQSVYMIKHLRDKKLHDETLFNCLLCGKCEIDCPVGIEINNLRITQRIKFTQQYNSSYSYLQQQEIQKADIVYFAGCMTHLTPGIVKAMEYFFQKSEQSYLFLDKDKAPCCGRPLMQAGQYKAAEELIQNNQQQIIASGAKTLVVSCPICYKVFKEDYHLQNIEVITHSEYILTLLETGKIKPFQTNKKIAYHDPCELGRGSGQYEIPRDVLKQFTQLTEMHEEKQDSICCGGSLSNVKASMEERDKMTQYALNKFLQYHPEMLVTACPLCKKTFNKQQQIQTLDIAELVYQIITQPEVQSKKYQFTDPLIKPQKTIEA